jgi:LmbE family N-acetylglucosaminyl deacetylase
MKDVILAIGAHPDDIDFFAGGTITKFCKEGMEAYFIITTNGQRGSLDSNADPKEIIRIREMEAREAAEVLGVREVFFLGYEDGFLDHRKVALAAFESCYFAHYPLFHPESPPYFVSELWLFRSPTPNHWVQLKNVRVKVKALMKHASQMKMLRQEILEQLKAASVDTTILEQIDLKTIVDVFVKKMAQQWGKEKKFELAEAFKVSKLGYYEEIKEFLESVKT